MKACLHWTHFFLQNLSFTSVVASYMGVSENRGPPKPMVIHPIPYSVGDTPFADTLNCLLVGGRALPL